MKYKDISHYEFNQTNFTAELFDKNGKLVDEIDLDGLIENHLEAIKDKDIFPYQAE